MACSCVWQSTAFRAIALALLAAAWLAVLPLAASAQQQPTQGRSLTDVRPRIPDEHDRPYFRETQTHRGWEIREPQFTIYAATSAADARWAASQVAEAWQQAGSLANRWTSVHHNPDFGLSALQVAIGSEPLRETDAPLTTVNVVGIQTQVQINVAPGQPGLPQQVSRLREAAAFAMLHAAGVDSIAPPWVVEGLASVAGRAGLSAEQLEPNPLVDRAAQFGGQQWRFSRATEDVLAAPPGQHEESAARIAFLLTGDDAEHAPALFTALGEATAAGQQAAAAGAAFAAFPGNPRGLPTNTPFDELLANLDGPYESWKRDPLAGQPVFEPAADIAPELLAAEREMLVLLKLYRRLAAAPPAAGPTTRVIDRGVVRTKIITFDRTKGPLASRPNETARRRASGMSSWSFADFAARLTDPSQPAWGTLDEDGSILLSTDTARVGALLALSDEQYAIEHDAGRAILVRRLSDGTSLRGWLQESPGSNGRPVAQFESARTKRVPRVLGSAYPATQWK